jgi:hypothetical protein
MRAKRFFVVCFVFVIWISAPVFAAGKVHVIVFGKWQTVQWIASGEQRRIVPLKIRAIIVDGKIKEYVLGSSHEVTDRLFVARRVFRVNDSLPQDSDLRWQWQRGGWLMVDRITGKISPINLPEFDPFYSAASWYRDYVAYCGVADDGKKTYAMVAQLSRRKPVLKKPVAEGVGEDAEPDSACPIPTWQREPMRVSFDLSGGRQTFAIRGRVADLVNETEEDDEDTK